MAALDFPASPSNGDTFGNWIYNSSKVAWQSKPLTAAKTVNSPTAPTSPAAGDQWFNTNTGQLFIYYTDANSSQWVESRAPITADGYISPNYLINGGMEIYQRVSSVSGTYQNKTFVADRWWGWTGTAATSFNMGENGFGTAPGHPSGLYVIRNVGNTSLSPIYVGQDIETKNSVALAGKTVTLSFYARKGSAFAGTLTAAIRSGTGTDQTMVSGYTGSTTIVNQDVASQLNTSTSTRVFVTATVPSNSTQVGVVFTYTPTTATAVSGDNFTITGVQLEEGTIATPFRRNANSLQGEFAACQRYYCKTESDSPWYMSGITFVDFEDRAIGGTTWPVQMRTTPTVVLYSGGANTVRSYGGLSDVSVTAYYADASGIRGIAHSGSYTVGRPYAGKFTASAEL